MEKYLIQTDEVTPLVQQVQELDTAINQGFSCRVEECHGKNYIHHSGRVKYVYFRVKYVYFLEVLKQLFLFSSLITVPLPIFSFVHAFKMVTTLHNCCF